MNAVGRLRNWRKKQHELSDNDQTIGENKAPQHTHALAVKRRPIVAQE